MADKPQTMIGPPDWGDSMIDENHEGEHLERIGCSYPPICTVLDPNEVPQHEGELDSGLLDKLRKDIGKLGEPLAHPNAARFNGTPHVNVRDEPKPTAYRPPPEHYSTGTGMDPWAVWDAFDLDRYTACAVKYLLRAGKKDIAPRLDDLKKARDYVNKAIEREEQK